MRAVGFLPGGTDRHSRRWKPDMNELGVVDPFAHLKQRASERAEKTVERIRVGIAALQATGRKITADSIKEVTRHLEPGFPGLSFQVIRRNARAYALYREAADAFSAQRAIGRKPRRRRRRATRAACREARSSYDPLQSLDKRHLVQRIRTLERELDAERARCCGWRPKSSCCKRSVREKSPTIPVWGSSGYGDRYASNSHTTLICGASERTEPGCVP